MRWRTSRPVRASRATVSMLPSRLYDISISISCPAGPGVSGSKKKSPTSRLSLQKRESPWYTRTCTLCWKSATVEYDERSTGTAWGTSRWNGGGGNGWEPSP
jgi:hypothetical protein